MIYILSLHFPQDKTANLAGIKVENFSSHNQVLQYISRHIDRKTTFLFGIEDIFFSSTKILRRSHIFFHYMIN